MHDNVSTCRTTNLGRRRKPPVLHAGYAVADVNYGGSTGYGRKYRKRLAGNWGVVGALAAVIECELVNKRVRCPADVRHMLPGWWRQFITCFPADVDDCSNAATHLAEQMLADPKKLCITGGSAGGYTTLACLAFKCAAENLKLATPVACHLLC